VSVGFRPSLGFVITMKLRDSVSKLPIVNVIKLFFFVTDKLERLPLENFFRILYPNGVLYSQM